MLLSGTCRPCSACSKPALLRKPKLDSAQAQAKVAEANVHMLEQKLHDRFSKGEIGHAESQVAEAQAAVSAASDLVRNLNVVSPFAGMAYNLPVRKDTFVAAGDLLVQVADLHRVRVRAFVDEPEIGRLQKGQPVEVTWDALPGRSWKGTVEYLPTNVVQHGTRMVGEVTCLLDNADLRLLPNTNVAVSIIQSRHDNALTVPREAVRQDSRGQVRLSDRRRQAQAAQCGNLDLEPHTRRDHQRPSRRCRPRSRRSQHAAAARRYSGQEPELMRRSSLILAALMLAALGGPQMARAALSPEQMIASGSVDEVIRTLSGRTDPASLNLLSRAYYAIEQWDNAVTNGEKAVAQSPENSMYHLWLGREYGQKASSVNPLSAASLAKKTKNEFEQAVKLDPGNVQARADISEYYTDAPSIMGGGLDKARDQAAQVAKYDEATSHWILALIAEKEKNYPEAESRTPASHQGSEESLAIPDEPRFVLSSSCAPRRHAESDCRRPSRNRTRSPRFTTMQPANSFNREETSSPPSSI